LKALLALLAICNVVAIDASDKNVLLRVLGETAMAPNAIAATRAKLQTICRNANKQLTALASGGKVKTKQPSDLPFNYSHPVEAPESDGLPLTKDTWRKGPGGKWVQDKTSCKTQITVTDFKGKTFRNATTCTSCDPDGKVGYGPTLEMKYAFNVKAGQCHGFYAKVLTRCTSLDRNEERAAPDATNVHCSKTGLLTEQAFLSKVTSKAARLFFRPVTRKAKSPGWAVARCNMIKHTACRGKRCEVKKSVQCASVCVENGWDGVAGMPRFKHCQKKFCKGKMGALACREIARMA